MKLKYICSCGHEIKRPIAFNQKILIGITYCSECHAPIYYFMVIDE
jgi:hypothetical protein